MSGFLCGLMAGLVLVAGARVLTRFACDVSAAFDTAGELVTLTEVTPDDFRQFAR